MATYTLRGRITDDHRLEVELPADAPAGAAEVTVTIREEQGSNSKQLLALIREWEQLPPIGRSAEEIEAYIQEARDSWD
jgi:hypothetical protein